jgi:hypothetical protein
MKTSLFTLLALIVVISGCDKIKDATTKDISTQLKTDIPVVVAASGKKSVDQTGTVNALAFTKTQDLTLASNADIEPYLNKIESIDLYSLVVTVTGLGAEQFISTMSLDVTGVGNIFTQTNISGSNNTFTPVIPASTLANVAAKLESERKITLTLSGVASGPMVFTVNLNFSASLTVSLV